MAFQVFHEISPGSWVHRPWWKRAINTALRAVQHGRPRMLLVYSKTVADDNGRPLWCYGYGFGWIGMRS